MFFEHSKLRVARLEKDISHEKLAHLLDSFISRQTLWNYENNVTVPDADILADIARALEKPITFFFTDPLNEVATQNNAENADEGPRLARCEAEGGRCGDESDAGEG